MATGTDASASMAAMPIPAPSLHSGQLSSKASEIADFGVSTWHSSVFRLQSYLLTLMLFDLDLWGVGFPFWRLHRGLPWLWRDIDWDNHPKKILCVWLGLYCTAWEHMMSLHDLHALTIPPS